jgi:hypothetical protein
MGRIIGLLPIYEMKKMFETTNQLSDPKNPRTNLKDHP